MRIIVGLLVCAATGVCGDTSSDRIRDTATKAIALLQSSQKSWYTKQSCSSCHQQVFPAIALRRAREHGLAVNEDIARRDVAKSVDGYSNLDRAVQYTHVIDPSMDDAFHLVGAEAAGVRPNIVTAVYARTVAQYQKPEGYWPTIDVRPPQSASFITATAVSARAIQLYHHRSLEADTRVRLEHARAWLTAQKPTDTEERTFQLLGLYWSGASKTELSKLAEDLARTQRDDGGWNTVTGRGSDAYSTGEALIALHDAGGMPSSDAVWSRGLRFLMDSQKPDGSWHVVSRLHPPASVSPPYFETGYPYGHDQFISAMGAAWAIMALATALGPAQKYEPPQPAEAVPTIQPWVETALFGNATELRALLDKKLDPNSATPGGTSALMLAMPDIDKAKLLLDRGANVNTRSKTRFSALLVAAHYPGASPVMRLLIERGAEVHMAKGSGAPLFNATALNLSMIAGNTEVVPLLLGKGDKLDDQMLFLGMFAQSAIVYPVEFDDAPKLAALLDAGLAVDTVDADGLTLLDWAVISNRLNAARLLISRGAKIDAVDKKGMTPLLYAASIDFGDSRMLDLLLQSKANRAARTKEGLTAVELARKYNHANLLKSLAP